LGIVKEQHQPSKESLILFSLFFEYTHIELISSNLKFKKGVKSIAEGRRRALTLKHLRLAIAVFLAFFIISVVFPLFTMNVNGQTVTSLSPSADSWVEAENPNTNRGSDTILRVKADSRIRRAYLKFDLTALPVGRAIASAKLYLYCVAANPTSYIQLNAHETGDSWSEGTITWNNAPAVGALAASNMTVGNINQFYSWSLTSYTQTQYSGDKVLSVVVKLPLDDPSQVNPNYSKDFASKENTNTAIRPYLEITFAPVSPVASFTFLPTHPVANETVAFDASASSDSDGSIVSYRWNFGDGNITTLTVPTIGHSYITFGNYTVTLTVTDNDGLTNSQSSIVEVVDPSTLRVSLPAGTYIDDNPDPWIYESWVLNQSGSSWSFTVRLNNTSTKYISYDTHLIIALNSAAYNNLVTLTVNGVSISKSAFVNGTPVLYGIYTYSKHGIYPTWFNDGYIAGTIPKQSYVDLTVSASFTDPTNAKIHFDAYGKVITGTPTCEGDITKSPNSKDSTVKQGGLPAPQPPIADFSWAPLSSQANEAVTFDASASYDPDGGSIVSYKWNFGDGNITTVSTPTIVHVYSLFGNYNVNLTVTDNEGQTASVTKSLTVRGHPVARFTYSPSSPLVGDPVTFDASSSTPDGGTITGYKWDFGDGNVTLTPNPIITHVYTASGQYNVTLTVFDSEGKSDSTWKIVTVSLKQYYLTVNTNPNGVTAISGEGWYTESTNVVLTAPTPVPNVTGVRYRFSYWDVDGLSQGIGVNPITVLMNANHTATAHYVKQYYLTVSSSYGATGGADWYDDGATAYVTVTPLTVSGPSGVQYVFTNWGGDATGTTSPSNPIAMNAPKTATANWKTQYYLTVGNGGHGTATGEGWYDAGSGASFSISPTTVSGGTGTQYVFTGWVGSGTGSYTGPDASRSVTMNNPITENAQWKTQYLVSFRQTGSAVAPNVNYTADIDPVSAVPFDVWVKAGSQIVYEYQGIVLGPTGTRYVFVGTNPASPQTVNGLLTITGTYKTQYFLTVNTNPAEVLTLNPTAVSGQGWYDSGDTATVDAVQSVNKVVDQSLYDFRTWAGATPTGVGNKASVLMSGPKTATANYQLQYKITFNQSGVGSDFPGTVVTIDGTNYGVVSSPTLPYSFWWDSGSSHSFAFQSPLVVTANSKQYVWTSTTGLSTLQSGSLTVSGSGSVTGNYKTQYYLTVTSPYDSPTPTTGWLDAGTVTASVTSPSPGPAGTQYICIGWTGTGSVPASGTGLTVTFTLNALSSITWNWKTQYYLTVKTSPSGIVTIPGEGWYNASVSVSLTAPSVVSYNFTNWDVDGVSQGAGVTSISVTMNSPHTATAHYNFIQPRAVPVGGRSIALIKQTPTSSLIVAYVMLIAMFSATLSFVRRKRKW